MALAELIGKLRTKKQTSSRTAFSHYIEAVRSLAAGGEIDADECSHILDAAGVDETRLEADVQLQQQRNAWHATMRANQQAVTDRIQAEAELQRAQAALQAAYDKLQPAIDQARAKLDDANHRSLTTLNADTWLAAHVLDAELIEREHKVSDELRSVTQELLPLESDRRRKQTHLANLESRLSELRATAGIPWIEPIVRPWLSRVNTDIGTIEARIADVENEIQQLNSAIEPRLRRRVALQNELNEIHQRKLEP